MAHRQRNPMIRSPADPDAYRVKVGRYGDRHYHDPLPADTIWPQWEDTVPAVTTIKKASPKDWSWTSLERAANYTHTRGNELAGLNPTEIHTRFLEINKAGLNRAANRGSAIHQMIEDIAFGRPQMFLDDTAKLYEPAAAAFIEDHRPEWIASEFVCISRLHRYGGTADAILQIGGATYLVDWKTRGPGKHGAYPEEAWQIAAYAHADYLITEDNGIAVRRPIPKVDGGLIVSICPDGYRLYPVDFQPAFESFLALREWFDAKQIDGIGKPITLTKGTKCSGLSSPGHDSSQTDTETTSSTSSTPASQTSTNDSTPSPNNSKHVELATRINHIRDIDGGIAQLRTRWPTDTPTPKRLDEATIEQLPAIERAIEQVEAHYRMPWIVPPAALVRQDDTTQQAPGVVPAPIIDEGPNDPQRATALIGQLRTLPTEQQLQASIWAQEANTAGAPISLTRLPSQRRCAIVAAVIEWAYSGDACMREALTLILGADAVQPHPTGALIGALRTSEALRLSALCPQTETAIFATFPGTLQTNPAPTEGTQQ